MKKKLLLALATLMCISLCACGGTESTSGDNTDTNTKTEESGGSSLFKTEKEIEITMDNWQDYFIVTEEIRCKVTLNAFDEIDYIKIDPVYSLQLKEEYSNAKEFTLAVEYHSHDFEVKTLKYNLNDNTYEIADMTEEDWANYKMFAEGGDNKNEVVEITNNNTSLCLGRYSNDSQEISGDIVSSQIATFPNLEILRIKGTLVIYE